MCAPRLSSAAHRAPFLALIATCFYTIAAIGSGAELEGGCAGLAVHEFTLKRHSRLVLDIDNVGGETHVIEDASGACSNVSWGK